MKTVTEWLESIENKLLSEKALTAWNTQHQYNLSTNTLKEAVDQIIWNRTYEGFEFWETYYDTL